MTINYPYLPNMNGGFTTIEFNPPKKPKVQRTEAMFQADLLAVLTRIADALEEMAY